MFNCDQCKKTSQPGETCNRVVDRKRDKEYQHTYTSGWGDKETTRTKTAKGWEIVTEINLCTTCFGGRPIEIPKPRNHSNVHSTFRNNSVLSSRSFRTNFRKNLPRTN